MLGGNLRNAYILTAVRILAMNANYLFMLAKRLRAGELVDEVLENDLLDELGDLWSGMICFQRIKLSIISAELARGKISLRELLYR